MLAGDGQQSVRRRGEYGTVSGLGRQIRRDGDEGTKHAASRPVQQEPLGEAARQTQSGSRPGSEPVTGVYREQGVADLEVPRPDRAQFPPRPNQLANGYVAS